MMTYRIAIFWLVLSVPAANAFAGTVRYDLPELLGEYRYDGSWNSRSGAGATFPMDVYVYHIAETRVVIECTVLEGKAHGDGIIYQPVAFDLPPRVGISANSNESTTVRLLEPISTVGPTTVVAEFKNPFRPRVTPMPGEERTYTYSVGLSFGLSFDTNFPPKLDPDADLYELDGAIVDKPIIAYVTAAYIELSGSTIVPEPSSIVLAVGAVFGLLFAWRRQRKLCA